MFSCIVTDNIQIAANAWVLSFPRNFEFTPGQVIGITLGTMLPARLYSICSGNKEPEIHILYNVKNDGLLTPELCKLRKGDRILVSTPSGKFTSFEKNAYWIATGTGIAPFASLIKSGYPPKVTLLQGARTETEFYFNDLFKNTPNITYIKCCSTCLESKFAFNGRLTLYLKQKNDLSPSQMYYLCGSAEMVVETRDILITKGVAFENIVSEIYF